MRSVLECGCEGLETRHTRDARGAACSATVDGIVASVQALVLDRIRSTCLAKMDSGVIAGLHGGKMLRTRLAARLLPHTPAAPDLVLAAAGAVEMVHAASLLHDDVIDGGEVRRGAPAFWKRFGPSGAILAGDVLFCCSADLFARAEGGMDLLPRFVAKMKEVCDAEAEQEIFQRGRPLHYAQWLEIARRKTGPLFAFVAEACGGGEVELVLALEEAGYRIGTAYQVADDLVDAIGDANAAGKTLGSDRERGKSTIAAAAWGPAPSVELVHRLCAGALRLLDPWPSVAAALRRYLAEDLQPVFDSHLHLPDLKVSALR